jgi:hypothetical protein
MVETKAHLICINLAEARRSFLFRRSYRRGEAGEFSFHFLHGGQAGA